MITKEEMQGLQQYKDQRISVSVIGAGRLRPVEGILLGITPFTYVKVLIKKEGENRREVWLPFIGCRQAVISITLEKDDRIIYNNPEVESYNDFNPYEARNRCFGRVAEVIRIHKEIYWMKRRWHVKSRVSELEARLNTIEEELGIHL